MTEVTYGQLDKVLCALGFTGRVLTSKPKARVYKHEETGALISLGYHPDGSFVRPHHLAAVQGTLEVFGIAEPLELAAELQRQADLEATQWAESGRLGDHVERFKLGS